MPEFSIQEKLCAVFVESYASLEPHCAHFWGSYAQKEWDEDGVSPRLPFMLLRHPPCRAGTGRRGGVPGSGTVMHILGEVMHKRKGMRTVYHQVCRSCGSATAPCAFQARAWAEFLGWVTLCTFWGKLCTKGRGRGRGITKSAVHAEFLGWVTLCTFLGKLCTDIVRNSRLTTLVKTVTLTSKGSAYV